MVLNGQAARLASNAARRALSPGGGGSGGIGARSKCGVARKAHKGNNLI